MNFHTFLFLAASSLGLVTMASCGKASAAEEQTTGAFKYREVYLPEGIGKNAENLGLNTLDDDWGIWGHNLHKAIPEEPSQTIYAKINGVANKKQYCFSSTPLFEYLEHYIDSKYDEDERIRFAIIPNDNDIVCLCEKCVTVGNTWNNASPAVTKLVRRLAERFPNHIFYTSDYRTTKSLPTDTMPHNSGVLVSAINYPLSPLASPEQDKFNERLRAWSTTTPRILVWDYINNFDDYFTPYPAFGVMQKRLKDYRDNNVTAVFLNGSGPDLSSMSRLRTEVLAQLTTDPDIDWKAVLYQKADSLYPVTGRLIADFMVNQEENVAEKGTVLPLYQGVQNAIKTYLPEEKFISFHDSIRMLKDQTKDLERKELELLLGQLALTRLELNRINGNTFGNEKYLLDLELLPAQGIDSYNESGWSIERYARDYRYLLSHAKEVGNRNKLKGEKLIAMTPLDPDYSDISILTDGVLGIPSNYHSGNMITSPDKFTQIAIPNKPGMRKVKVWLTYNPTYRITLPEAVTLSIKGVPLKTVNPSYPEDTSGHVPVEFDIPSNSTGTLLLTLHKEPETHSMAIEEIEGF